jgi:4-diphosphocytidyl-2C-methyl-D-erythritol kinase
VLVPKDETKVSTAEVYAAFDEWGRSAGYDGRRSRLLEALAAGDLAGLPPNDLATPSHAEELRRLGAFRADLSGAGPAVYGLFPETQSAEAAGAVIGAVGRVWIGPPAW